MLNTTVPLPSVLFNFNLLAFDRGCNASTRILPDASSRVKFSHVKTPREVSFLISLPCDLQYKPSPNLSCLSLQLQYSKVPCHLQFPKSESLSTQGDCFSLPSSSCYTLVDEFCHWIVLPEALENRSSIHYTCVGAGSTITVEIMSLYDMKAQCSHTIQFFGFCWWQLGQGLHCKLTNLNIHWLLATQVQWTTGAVSLYDVWHCLYQLGFVIISVLGLVSVGNVFLFSE